MNKTIYSHKKLIVSFIAIIILSISAPYFTSSSQAASGKFGQQPFTDVKNAVNNYRSSNGITNISANELTAMVLAVVWPETTGGSLSYTPAPMTLSRADGGHVKLWSFENTSSSPALNDYIQSHFNPGIGLWQLDTSGLGKPLAAYEAINVKTAAPVAIHNIYSTWNNASGTAAQKRAMAWKPWFACGSSGSVCESVFNQIFVNNSLNIIEDSSVSSMGGMVIKSCSMGIPTPPYSLYFPCYKIDPSLAEGHLGSWHGTVLGNYSASPPINPLSKAFISFKDGTNDKRYWFKSDTGYSNTRPFSQDARSANVWSFSNDVTY